MLFWRASLIALIGLSGVRSAFAQSADVAALARARWTEGAQALERGDLESAKRAFRAAYDVFPNPELAQSLGEVEFRAGDFAAAARHLTVALENKKLTAEERRISTKSLQKALANVGVLQVDVDVDGTDVTLDGEFLGRSPLGLKSSYADAGAHLVAVHKDGYSDETQLATVGAGETVRLSFTLRPKPKPISQSSEVRSPPIQPVEVAPRDSSNSEHSPPPRTTEPSIARSSSARTAVLVTSLVLTGVSLGLGGYFLVREGNDQSNADALRSRAIAAGGCQIAAGAGAPRAGAGLCQELVDSYPRIDQDRNLAIGSFAAAGILGTATAATYLLWPKAEGPTIRVNTIASGAIIALIGRF